MKRVFSMSLSLLLPSCAIAQTPSQVDLETLDAQWHTVYATWASVCISALALMATIAGIVYVWRTYNAALDANSMLRAENRAWIDILLPDDLAFHQKGTNNVGGQGPDGVITWQKVDVPNEHPWIELTIRSRNIGKTVAENVHLQIKVAKGEWNKKYEPSGRLFYENAVGKRKGASASYLFPGQEVMISTSVRMSPEWLSEPTIQGGPLLMPTLIAFVSYQIAGGKEAHHTGKVFTFQTERDHPAKIFAPTKNYHGHPVSSSVQSEVTYIS